MSEFEEYIGQVNFHGGCIGCTNQEIYGYEFCMDCRYFDPDWDLPDLSNAALSTADQLKIKLKARYDK